MSQLVASSVSYADPESVSPGRRYRRSLHWASLLTLILTFPLIFMGGLVTSHAAGMAVPDWPNSFGYNMFLFPPSQWVGGIFYEHVHRLAGTLVGMTAIVQAILAWRLDRRPWARWVAYSVLLLVIAQGVLGGLRVIWVKLDLAIVHACVGQAFFCLAGYAALITSRWWTEDASTGGASRAGYRAVAAAGWVCVGLIYAQLIVGAMMRHYQAGLAIPDLPLAYGQLLPPVSEDGLAAANATRAWQLELGPVTLTQVWLHFGHRIGAIVVTLGVLVTAARVLALRRGQALVPHAIWMLGLLLFQFTLGLLVVYYRKPADLASIHVAAGALLLLFTFLLTVKARRLAQLAAVERQA